LLLIFLTMNYHRRLVKLKVVEITAKKGTKATCVCVILPPSKINNGADNITTVDDDNIPFNVLHICYYVYGMPLNRQKMIGSLSCGG
jgi:hypothetical protein